MARIYLFLLLLLVPATARSGDLIEEKITTGADGSVWAFRWTSNPTPGGMLWVASDDEAQAELMKRAKKRCREEGHQSFRLAGFEDIHGAGADPLLAKAWEHFGGGTQQSSVLRKTSFKLLIFADTQVSATHISSKATLTSCWTDRQRKTAAKEEKRRAAHEKRRQKMAEKVKAKHDG